MDPNGDPWQHRQFGDNNSYQKKKKKKKKKDTTHIHHTSKVVYLSSSFLKLYTLFAVQNKSFMMLSIVSSEMVLVKRLSIPRSANRQLKFKSITSLENENESRTVNKVCNYLSLVCVSKQSHKEFLVWILSHRFSDILL